MIPSDLTATAPGQKTAIVTPLTVEIAVVKIGNRQMTQSVFKQLPERKLARVYLEGVPPEATINWDGDIWGHVRYDPSGENAVHLLYSLGGKLYKDRFHIPDFFVDKRVKEVKGYWIGGKWCEAIAKDERLIDFYNWEYESWYPYYPDGVSAIDETIKAAEMLLNTYKHWTDNTPQLFIAV